MRRLMKKRGSKISFKKIVIIVALALFIGFGVWFDLFERTKPSIFIQDVIYTNLEKPLPVRITDEQSGINRVQIVLKKDLGGGKAEDIVLYDDKPNKQKELVLEIALPKIIKQGDKFTLFVRAEDKSLWNLGNESIKNIPIVLDNTSPAVNILANSYQIEQGGIAAVVFKARDENLAELYIENDKGRKFKVSPYLQSDHFAAIIAWDAMQKDFRAFVVAKDKAGNITKERIRYYLINRKYRVSKLNLSDKFLDGKIEDLANQYAPEQNLTRLEKFKFVNETLRQSNEDKIHKLTQSVGNAPFEDFKIAKFAPLKNAAKVADFADHRYYSYMGEFVSDSYHMGLDLASIARDKIYANLDGKVIFAEENGIYGINIIIDHGFGIYSLYGHCSAKMIAVGDIVKAGDIIAKTGISGLALGDHLHFGVLVQGIEVRPEQFMDEKWLQSNILAVFAEGRKIILGLKNESNDDSKKR